MTQVLKIQALAIILLSTLSPLSAQKNIFWGIDNTALVISSMHGEPMAEVSFVKPAAFLGVNKNIFHVGTIAPYQNESTVDAYTNYSFFFTYERTLLNYRNRFWLYGSFTNAFTNGKILYERGFMNSDDYCRPCYYTSNSWVWGIAAGAKFRVLKRLQYTLGAGWGRKYFLDTRFKQKNGFAGILMNMGIGYFFTRQHETNK